MTIDTVLFDFSSTLFDPARVVDGPALAACAERRGRRLEVSRAQLLGQQILEYGESPAGLRARARCDLSAAEHRAGWLATAVLVPGVDPVLADAFHDCITDPARWRPYDDTGPVLILSSDAGAADELSPYALTVDPGDVGQLTGALGPAHPRHGRHRWWPGVAAVHARAGDWSTHRRPGRPGHRRAQHALRRPLHVR